MPRKENDPCAWWALNPHRWISHPPSQSNVSSSKHYIRSAKVMFMCELEKWVPDPLSPGFVKRGRKPIPDGYSIFCSHPCWEGCPELKCTTPKHIHFVQCEICGWWHEIGIIDELWKRIMRKIYRRKIEGYNSRRPEGQSLYVVHHLLRTRKGQTPEQNYREASSGMDVRSHPD